MPSRCPFPYESDIAMLKACFVPDPLPEDVWQKSIGSWPGSSAGTSFLEWMVQTGTLDSELLFESLLAATGAAPAPVDWKETHAPVPAEMALLSPHGFIYLGKQGRIHSVVGGPRLCPDLSLYLGKRAAQWSWQLLDPIRRISEPQANHPEETSHSESVLMDIVEEARMRGAADIHFERAGKNVQIRLKCAGGMLNLPAWDFSTANTCFNLLKRWAGFNSALQGMPQDGRFSIGENHQKESFRASHIHTVDGESLVLRRTRGPEKQQSLDNLGAPAILRSRLTECAFLKPGLLLFSGATCSGKTTTLYAVLQELTRHALKILTIEDPVEREISGTTQSNVNEAVGWDYPNALRAYLRQDPDVIMVGELRDPVSAKLACQAGITGHAVLATIHGLDPVRTLNRLQAWDIPPGLIADSVRLVVHQSFSPTRETDSRIPKFSWIEPAPEEIRTYLDSGLYPAGWSGKNRDKQRAE